MTTFEFSLRPSTPSMRFSRIPIYPVVGSYVESDSGSCSRRLPEKPSAELDHATLTAIETMVDEIGRSDFEGRLLWCDHDICFGNDGARQRSHPFVLARLGGQQFELKASTISFRNERSSRTFTYTPAIDRGQAICRIPVGSDGEREFLHFVREGSGSWSAVWLPCSEFESLVLENAMERSLVA